MYEATLRITGRSAYADATAGTAASIELWCNRHCDLLHVSAEAADEVEARVSETVGVRERLRNRGETVLVTGDCLRDHEADLIESVLDRHGCLLLYPLEYEGGDKICRVLSLSAGALTDCFHDLLAADAAVTVESKRKIDSVRPRSPLLAPHGVAPDLTDRQSAVLRYAADNGYYEIPRAVTTAEIADAVGVTRRTAEEHLRRAENKLVDSLVDVVA
ncbi:helix-turn-helix domain-containing protein [Halorarum halobium]|uniref:helix-turn-helix domain-containing protein n=1 Tax=Halorarum halobium TaxID=3075121 RepID=UPI0028B2323E|nr:helix-turn-helix domain-containing protein [Halobaculum sp. XH14]